MSVALYNRRLPVNFRYAPLATEVVWRCNMSRRARLCKKTGISTALRPHRRQLARLNTFLLEAISGRAWRSLGRLLASI